jgi:exosome complex exonuclease RRP6
MLELVEVVATNIEPQVFAPKNYFMHPYYTELKNLTYPDWQMSEVSVTTPSLPPVESNFLFIDSEAGVINMLEEIKTVKEIAISLLNHSFRSFQGFCCIIQISTRFKDYALDAIILRQKLGNLLGPICANPSLIKIFHNGQHDILWLQRDFGIYIVNCFDTFEAANLLKYPSLTLSHILRYYGGPSLHAQHKFCDWRIRPIDNTLLRCACNNTRYIVYVYDALRNDLNRVYGREGLEAVLNVSRKLCLRRYENEPFWPLGYRKLLNIPRKNAPKSDVLTDAQDKIMRELWKWRDSTARDLDECIYYVMSNSELIRISSIMPTTISSLIDNCAPLSVLVRKNQEIIIEIIKSVINETTQHDSEYNFRLKNAGHYGEDKILYGRALRTPSKELDCVDVNSSSINVPSGYGAMYTFTPAVVLAPPSLSVQSPSPVNHFSTKYSESPVMPAEDIFKLAGWSTPGSDIINGTVSSPTFDEKYQVKLTQIDGGNEIKRAEKRIDDIDTNVLSTVSIKNSIRGNDTKSSRNIPETFEEIYEISNRNRKRNKDKRKQNDEDENNSEPLKEFIDIKNNAQKANNFHTTLVDTQKYSQVRVESSNDLSSSLFDEMKYFTYFNQGLDNSIDSTLDFVENLGWIKDFQERSKIKEESILDSSE